jgi:hypothetical protein
MERASAKRIVTELRFVGNGLIAVAIVMLIINSSWAHAVAIAAAVVGIGLRIEAAITAMQGSDASQRSLSCRFEPFLVPVRSLVGTVP